METIFKITIQNVMERIEMIREMYEDEKTITEDQYNEAMVREFDQMERVVQALRQSHERKYTQEKTQKQLSSVLTAGPKTWFK